MSKTFLQVFNNPLSKTPSGENGACPMSINRANISGNLTRDPELRATQGGTEVLSFSVAVNDRRKNQQTGEWEDAPNFIDCVMFGSRAVALSRILAKGVKVAVDGKLRQSTWETKDGSKRSKIEVVVDEVDIMSGGGQRQQQRQQPQQPDFYDENIPF